MKPLGILRNDKFLRGSDPPDPPATRLAKSSGIIYAIGVLNIAFGVLALTDMLNPNLGFVIMSFVIGFIFFVLGFFTQRRSLIALIIALIIYCLEIVLVLFIVFVLDSTHKIITNIIALVLTLTGDNSWLWVVLILSSAAIIAISIGIPIVMGRGIGAINKLKKETPPTRQK